MIYYQKSIAPWLYWFRLINLWILFTSQICLLQWFNALYDRVMRLDILLLIQYSSPVTTHLFRNFLFTYVMWGSQIFDCWSPIFLYAIFLHQMCAELLTSLGALTDEERICCFKAEEENWVYQKAILWSSIKNIQGGTSYLFVGNCSYNLRS